MVTAFYYPVGYRMEPSEPLSGISGSLIIPSKVQLPMLERRTFAASHLHRRLLDPQLYLSGLNPMTCPLPCARLATYGWFGDSGGKYDSSQHKHNKWLKDAQLDVASRWSEPSYANVSDVRARIDKCIALQVTLGCEAVILPSPLTVNLATDYTEEILWLDEGLEAARKLAPHMKVLATVALSDTCLRPLPPLSNRLLDAVLDHVTARGAHGVYIVIEQANEDGYYITHPNTVGSLLRLVREFVLAQLQHVIVGFAGVAGLLAAAFGASGWVTGWYRGERRLRLQDFEKGGRSYPAYYSHPLGSEIHMKEDFDRIASNGFAEFSDATKASAGLLAAVARGKKVASVPAWQHLPGNISAATQHFFEAMIRETDVLNRIPVPQRGDAARKWMHRAADLANATNLMGDLNARTALSHQAVWLNAVTSLL